MTNLSTGTGSALLVAVQAGTWPESAERLQRLEALFARTPLFQRPR